MKISIVHFTATPGLTVAAAMADSELHKKREYNSFGTVTNNTTETLCGKKIRYGALLLPLGYVVLQNVTNRLCDQCHLNIVNETGSLVDTPDVGE